MATQLAASTLRLHILLLFLEFPELRLDGHGGSLGLRVFHVDVKIFREVVFLFIWGEEREMGEEVVGCVNLQE